MLNKQLAAADALVRLRDGMTIGFGGWGVRRKPMAMVREILRRRSILLPPPAATLERYLKVSDPQRVGVTTAVDGMARQCLDALLTCSQIHPSNHPASIGEPL